MITDDDQARLKKISGTDKTNECKLQLQRIHRAVNDGTLDRTSVDDALARLALMITPETIEKVEAEAKPNPMTVAFGPTPPIQPSV